MGLWIDLEFNLDHGPALRQYYLLLLFIYMGPITIIVRTFEQCLCILYQFYTIITSLSICTEDLHFRYQSVSCSLSLGNYLPVPCSYQHIIYPAPQQFPFLLVSSSSLNKLFFVPCIKIYRNNSLFPLPTAILNSQRPLY